MHDIENIKKSLSKENLDYNKYKHDIEIPLAFLNDINVNYKSRGLGFGRILYNKFEEFCESDTTLLAAG